ncbi:MAG: hypothetical protein JO129_01845 [Candidatus Dependentiae bacterium]|nr:hypothetical protein [Candidatus Dependentiae bacterium]
MKQYKIVIFIIGLFGLNSFIQAMGRGATKAFTKAAKITTPAVPAEFINYSQKSQTPALQAEYINAKYKQPTAPEAGSQIFKSYKPAFQQSVAPQKSFQTNQFTQFDINSFNESPSIPKEYSKTSSSFISNVLFPGKIISDTSQLTIPTDSSTQVQNKNENPQELTLPTEQSTEQIIQKPIPQIEPEPISIIEQEPVSPIEYNPMIMQPQTITEYDISQQYIASAVKNSSVIIDSWTQENKDATSNIYIQQNLQDDLFNTIAIKDSQGNLQFIDPENDVAIIENLLKKYEKDSDISHVLQNSLMVLNKYIQSQQVTPKQANSVIARYYSPNMRNDIFSIFKIEPKFDATGVITNMPSIEAIIQEAKDNPTAQTFKALQASLKATNIAIYALRTQTSVLGDSPLLAQVKSFKNDINTALKNPHMDKFQSWGSYATSLLPTTEQLLTTTGIGNINLSTAVQGAKTAIDTANSALTATGITNMNISQVAEKAGLIPSEKPTRAPVQTARDLDIAKNLQIQANSEITQYFTPAMQNDIVAVTHTNLLIDPTNGSITNMPSIEEITQKALENPTQETFNALQSMLEATKVAIFANNQESSILGRSQLLKQLQSYKKQLTTTLKDPRFTPFQSWTTRATSYVASFLPSAKTTLDVTGIGNVKVSQVVEGVKQTLDVAHQALTATGTGNMTISQALTKAGVIQPAITS